MIVKVQKLISTIALIVLTVIPSKAQLQEVSSSSGGYFEGNSFTVSYTLGETVIQTLNTDNLMLTQGFHQPSLVVTAIDEMKGLSIDINVYPNPVNNYLHLTTSEKLSDESSYQLFNMNGELITQSQLEGLTTTIECHSLVAATYLLRVTSNKQTLKSFKIIKK